MTTLMKLRTTRIVAMQQAVGVLRHVATDAVFRCFPWGIRTYALDQPHETSIVRLDLEKSAVASEGGEYVCDLPEPLNLGVSLAELQAALGTATARDTLVMEAVVLRNSSASSSSSSMSLPERALRIRLSNAQGRDSIHDINLLDMDAVDLKFPDPTTVRGSRQVTLDSAALHEACKRVHTRHGNHLLFTLTPKDLVVQSVGTLGKVSENIRLDLGARDIGISAELSDQDLLSTVFNEKAVYRFVRAHKMAPEIEVTLAPHFVLIMTYRLSTLGALSIYISPFEGLSDAEKIQHKDMIAQRV